MKKDTKDFYQTVAGWLPRKLVYFCVIRVWANATTGKYGKEVVNEVSVDKALQRWK